MASFVECNSVWAPNPLPTRGVSYSIDSDGKSIAYGSGYSLVIRGVDNPQEVKVFTGHKKHVTAVRFTPDLKLVASGDASGTLIVWKVDSGEIVKELPGVVGGPLLDIAFDEAGKRVAVCADAKGNNAKVFMWESGTAQGELLSSKPVLSIAIRHDSTGRLAHGGQDFKVKFYKGPPFKFDSSNDEHTNFVQCVRYSPDGAYLATAGSDMNIHILDAETGDLKFKLPAEHKGSIYRICWSDDAKYILSCGGDKAVKLWDVAGQKCVSTVVIGKKVDDMQMGCCLAGETAVSISLCGDLNILDMKNSKLLNVIQGHNGVPQNLAVDWATGGSEVYVGSSEGPVFAYSPDGHASRFDGPAPGPNDGIVVNKKKLFSVGHDDTLRCAEVGSGVYAFSGTTCVIPGTPLSLSAAAGDPTLCVTCTEEAVILVRNGKVTDSKPLKGYTATCAAIAEDGSEVAVGGSDKAAHIFEVSNDKLEATSKKLDGLQGAVSAIAYSPEGPIAVGDNVKEITLWDRESRECLIRNKWVFHTSKITSLCFSPSGKHMASTSTDSQVIIWNPEKKLSKTKIQNAHTLGTFSVAWIDDGTIVSGGGDGCIRRWTPKLP